MIPIEDIKVGSIWRNRVSPGLKAEVIDVAIRRVGKGGWVSYRVCGDTHVSSVDSVDFQVGYEVDDEI